MSSDTEIKNLKAQHHKYLLYFLYIIFPTCSTVVFQTFKCTDVDGTWFLDADLRQECYTGAWVDQALFATLGVLMYPIGIPVLFAVNLFANKTYFYVPVDVAEKEVKYWRERLALFNAIMADGSSGSLLTKQAADAAGNLKQAEKKLAALFQRLERMNDASFRFGFIYAQYTSHAYYWELTELFRKLILCSILIFVAPGSTAQLCTAMLICFLFYLSHLYIEPYLSQQESRLQLASLLSTIFTTIAALILRANADSTDESGLQDKILVHGSLLACNALVVMLFMYTLWSITEQEFSNETDPIHAIIDTVASPKCTEVMNEAQSKLAFLERYLVTLGEAGQLQGSETIVIAVRDAIVIANAETEATNKLADAAVEAKTLCAKDACGEKARRQVELVKQLAIKALELQEKCGAFAGLAGRKRLIKKLNSVRVVTYRHMAMKVFAIVAEFQSDHMHRFLIDIVSMQVTAQMADSAPRICTDIVRNAVWFLMKSRGSYDLLKDRIQKLFDNYDAECCSSVRSAQGALRDSVELSLGLCGDAWTMHRLTELTVESEGRRLKARGVPPLAIHIMKRLGEIAVEMTLNRVAHAKGGHKQHSQQHYKKYEDTNEAGANNFETEVNGNEFGVMRFFIILEALPQEPEAATLQILQLATSLVHMPYLAQELAMILGRLIEQESDCSTEAYDSYLILPAQICLLTLT